MTGHGKGRGKPGPKPSKADADARDLAILAAVARGEKPAVIAPRHDVTESFIRLLLANTRKDARAPLGRNGDVRAQP